MGTVLYSAGVDEIRGSIGGVTFSRNSSGPFARARKKPRYKRTNEAQRLATALSYYSAMWGYILDAAERAAWNTLAAATPWVNPLGETYYPSGLNLYVRSNVLLHLAGAARQDTAPASADETSPVFTLDYNAGDGIRLTNVGILTSPPTGYILSFFSGPQRLSISSYSTPWHFFRVDAVAGVGLPLIILAAADCLILTRYFFRLRVIRDSGMATASFFAQQDTPAVL